MLPPRPDAALHRRDPGSRDQPRRGRPPTTRREKATGRGLGILRDEGVEVEVVDGEPAVRARLREPGVSQARAQRPPARALQVGDDARRQGRHAHGDSQWISGEEARLLSHQWRAERDAVVVGIGTALADDPQLTARIPGVARQPRRVVFDSEGRLPLDSQLVRGAPEVPLTVVVARAAPRLQTEALEAAGAEVVVATVRTSRRACARRSTSSAPPASPRCCSRAGRSSPGAFLDAGEIDELRLFIAPIVLGGSNARDPLEGEGVERIAEATRALAIDVERIGDDVLISARLREW